jgi:hypothetical protein
MRITSIALAGVIVASGIMSVTQCSADPQVDYDNDELAFEFVNSQPDPIYVVMDECYDYGMWTIEILYKVESDLRAMEYVIDKTKSREDVCYELYTLFGE